MMLPIDKDEFIEFNKRNFPKRKENSFQTLIDWRIKSNPYFTSFNSGLISTNNEKMNGQIIPIYSKFISDNKAYDCVWGSDYIVDEAYRGGNAGVRVFKTIVKNYLHFGVGMSDVSLEIHKIFREKCVGLRYDCFFLSIIRTKRKFKIAGIDSFITDFNSKFSKCYSNVEHSFFARDPNFYNWVFKMAKKEKLKVVYDEMNDFVLFYKGSYLGLPLVKIVDFSPRLNDDPEKFMNMITYFSQQSMTSKLFYYSGSINITNFVKSYRLREFPVYSNMKALPMATILQQKVHITGLDSDRFISEFL